MEEVRWTWHLFDVVLLVAGFYYRNSFHPVLVPKERP